MKAKKIKRIMLTHIKNYEKYSGAELNEKKSQILSFGEKTIDKISEIKQCEKDEKVRHLGFYFNKNGIINNIDEIIENIFNKLKILKNLFPNFTTRINIWKGYAISSLLYLSEILVITEKQIKKFEKMEKKFLFEKEMSGSLDDKEKTNCNISLERLEQKRKFGGLNLKRILNIFSASKSKVIIRSMLEENKNKPCFILLREKSRKLFEKQSKFNTAHPIYTTDVSNTNLERRFWEWFWQANIIYSQIDKDLTFYPQHGQTIFDWFTKKIIHISDEKTKNLYEIKNKTIPIKITENALMTYKHLEKIKNKNQENEKIFEMSPSEINKDEITKANHSTWMNGEKIEYLGFKEGQKITLNSIFKNMISDEEETQPLWTEKQEKWIKKGVDLKKLLSIKIKTLPKIEDFRRKFLLNFWSKMRFHKCPFCQGSEIKFNIKHLLLKCPTIKEWEEYTYGLEKREKRIKAFWNHKDPNYLSSWIFNWCIWKNVWDIKFERLPNLTSEKHQTKNFQRHLKENEYVHIKIILEKRKDVKENKNKYNKETDLFKYYQLNEEEEEENKN